MENMVLEQGSNQCRDVSLSIERPLSQMLKFTPEACGGLERLGCKIYSLTGQSIRTLRDAGKTIRKVRKDYLQLEEMTSRLTEVAINPNQLFLPGSNGKTLAEQERMMAKFSSGLQINGVEAVIGEMPDYVELIFQHLDETESHLFDKDYHGHARTKTKNVAVGYFHIGRGQYIPGWGHVKNDDNVFVIPLIVPVNC